SKKSILSASVQHHDGFIADAFLKGREAAKVAPLLQARFWVRTQQLLGKMNKAPNFHFLLPSLIGSELKELAAHAALSIYLCSGASLSQPYHVALQQYGFDHVSVLSDQPMDQAVVRGQYTISQKMLHQ